jgi:hypothetical protein
LQVEGEATTTLEPRVPAGADLRVSLGGLLYREILAGDRQAVYVSFSNLGPSTAENAVLDVTITGGQFHPGTGSPCRTSARTVRCTVDRMSSGGSVPLTLFFVAASEPGPFRIEAIARSATEDPVRGNDTAVLQSTVTATSLFNVRTVSPGAVDPGELAIYSATFEHRTAIDARDVVVSIPIPPDWTLVEVMSPEWSCNLETKLVCCTARIAAGSASELRYALRASASRWGDRGRVESFTITSANGALKQSLEYVTYAVRHLIEVTTVADEGPGSLRDAIARSNRECAYDSAPECKIIFEINGTIRPRTPLPRIEGNHVLVDARPHKVELVGSDTASGSGLEIASDGRSGVRGMIIRDFPQHGIAFDIDRDWFGYRSRHVVADNVITANGSRGVSVDTRENVGSNLDLVANDISGNARSGVFVSQGRDLLIASNRISANGASGMFLGNVSGSRITENAIADNREAGISIDRRATWNAIVRTAMANNGGLAIDHGLDGVTRGEGELPEIPLILSARFDAATGITRIEGVAPAGTREEGIVELFANTTPDPTGFGETESFLGRVELPRSPSTRTFTLAIPQDLRGKAITATFTRRSDGAWSWTSEVSQAVGVE